MLWVDFVGDSSGMASSNQSAKPTTAPEAAEGGVMPDVALCTWMSADPRFSEAVIALKAHQEVDREIEYREALLSLEPLHVDSIVQHLFGVNQRRLGLPGLEHKAGLIPVFIRRRPSLSSSVVRPRPSCPLRSLEFDRTTDPATKKAPSHMAGGQIRGSSPEETSEIRVHASYAPVSGKPVEMIRLTLSTACCSFWPQVPSPKRGQR